MKKIKIILIMFVVTVLIGLSQKASAYNTSLSEFPEEVQIDLRNDLESIKEQLIEQDALDKYSYFENIILNRYSNLFISKNNNTDDQLKRISTIKNNGIRCIVEYDTTYGDVWMRETYLNARKTDELYEAISAPNISKSLVEFILGSLSTPFGGLSFYRESTIRRPLYELRQAGKPSLIISSIDRYDSYRETTVVTEWRNYSTINYPTYAKNVRIYD